MNYINVFLSLIIIINVEFSVHAQQVRYYSVDNFEDITSFINSTSPCIYKDMLIYRYHDDAFSLALFGNREINLLNNLDNTGSIGSDKPCFFDDKVYFTYSYPYEAYIFKNEYLVEWDGANLEFFLNKNNQGIFTPVVYNDKLYFRTLDTLAENSQLAYFNGEEIQNVSNYDDYFLLGDLGLTKFNGSLISSMRKLKPDFDETNKILGAYNGSNWKLYEYPEDPDGDHIIWEEYSKPIIFKNELYFMAFRHLFKLSNLSDSIVVIESEPIMGKNHIVYKDNLYWETTDNYGNLGWMKFNGVDFSEMPKEIDDLHFFSFGKIVQNNLFLTFRDDNLNSHIVRYDGEEFTCIVQNNSWSSKAEKLIEFKNNIYLLIGEEYRSNNIGMIKKDSVKIITDYTTSIGESIVYNDTLLFRSKMGMFYVVDDSNITGILNSIKQEAEGQITIYPNPTNDIVNIICAENGHEKNAQIYNSRGILIDEKRTQDTSFSFDLTGYSRGIYVVKIMDGKNAATKKIVLN